MDYVTRQFIVLARKLRDEFHKLSDTLHRDLSHLSESVENLNNSIDKRRETDKETDDAQPSVAITDLRTDVPIPVDIRTKKTKPEWAWAIIKSLLEAGGIAAVVWYACVTNSMWKEMQRQTKIQRDASINQERAWVGLNGSVITDVLQAMPKVRIGGRYSIENFGHGPALKVFPNSMPVWEYKGADYRKTAEMVCVPAIEFATGTVPYGPGVSNPGPMGYTLFPGQIHDEQIGDGPWEGEGLTKPMQHFWFIGCVAYLDQFKAVHWTRFCMESSFTHQPINKDTPLQFCALYNDAGDWEPKK